MPQWMKGLMLRNAFKRLGIRRRLARINVSISNELEVQGDLLIELWSALEARDAIGYAHYDYAWIASVRAVRKFQTQRDELTRQLERL